MRISWRQCGSFIFNFISLSDEKVKFPVYKYFLLSQSSSFFVINFVVVFIVSYIFVSCLAFIYISYSFSIVQQLFSFSVSFTKRFIISIFIWKLKCFHYIEDRLALFCYIYTFKETARGFIFKISFLIVLQNIFYE